MFNNRTYPRHHFMETLQERKNTLQKKDTFANRTRFSCLEFFRRDPCFRQALNLVHLVVPFTPPLVYFIGDISLPNRSVFFKIRQHLTQSLDLTKIHNF